MSDASVPGLSSVQLVVCDLDGTLLNSQKQITPEALSAIDTLRRQGIRFSVCTGRIPTMAQCYFDELALDIPAITVNGALIYDSVTRQGIHGYPLDPGEALKIAAACARLDVEFCAFGLNGCWFVKNSFRIARFHQYNAIAAGNGCDPVRLFTFDDSLSCFSQETIYKLLISTDSPEKAAAVCRVIDDQPHTGYTSSEDNLLDVSHRGANKGTGVLWLADSLRIPAHAVMSIGDYLNDIPMLGVSGLAVAMGNARDEVKAAAHFVTADNDHNGAACAMQKLVRSLNE